MVLVAVEVTGEDTYSYCVNRWRPTEDVLCGLVLNQRVPDTKTVTNSLCLISLRQRVYQPMCRVLGETYFAGLRGKSWLLKGGFSAQPGVKFEGVWRSGGMMRIAVLSWLG
ncbi:hypothetical protein U1Q18_017281 [Sarracenia purpurea var. burkii]